MIGKEKLFVIAAGVMVLLFPAILSAQQNDPKAVELVKRWEERLNVENLDITNLFTLVQKRQNEPDRVLRVQIYRRDLEESYTLIYLYPDSEKGKGYLDRGGEAMREENRSNQDRFF
jgi:hypothetical protein